MAKNKDFQKEINKLMGQLKQNLKKFGITEVIISVGYPAKHNL